MKIKSSILAAIVIATAVAGCSRSNVGDDSVPVSGTNSLSVTQQLQNAKEIATNAWQKTKEATTNAMANIKEETTNAWANVKESVLSAMDYTYDKKDAFVAKASSDLDAMDQKIKELSDKAATASDAVKAEAQTKIQGLRDKRTALGEKLDEVKNSVDSNWNDVKAGFKKSYEDVKNSVKDAWQWLADKLGS